jgi:Zn finger protein HypA/HybF involved in hydrogenase expression
MSEENQVHEPTVEDDPVEAEDETSTQSIVQAAMESAGDALQTALEPLASKLKTVVSEMGGLKSLVNGFDSRMETIEKMTLACRRELDDIQGRGVDEPGNKNVVTNLKDQKTKECPGCGTPNVVNTLPGETILAASRRVTCHRCGLPWGNENAVARARQQNQQGG